MTYPLIAFLCVACYAAGVLTVFLAQYAVAVWQSAAEPWDVDEPDDNQRVFRD